MCVSREVSHLSMNPLSHTASVRPTVFQLCAMFFPFCSDNIRHDFFCGGERKVFPLPYLKGQTKAKSARGRRILHGWSGERRTDAPHPLRQAHHVIYIRLNQLLHFTLWHYGRCKSCGRLLEISSPNTIEAMSSAFPTSEYVNDGECPRQTMHNDVTQDKPLSQ